MATISFQLICFELLFCVVGISVGVTTNLCLSVSWKIIQNATILWHKIKQIMMITNSIITSKQ